MSKSTNFSGQPILNQLIMFLDKGKIRKIAMQNQSDWYVKKFSTYNHVVVMLFLAFEGYHSIREVVLGLLVNAHKLSHLGLSYVVRRSTFSEANQRRNSKIFGDIYMSVYRKYASSLADSRLSDTDMKRLYIMDSTTMNRKWAFSNMVSIIRQQLMNYINIYNFLEDPEGSWRKIIKEDKASYQNSLFPKMQMAYF